MASAVSRENRGKSLIDMMNEAEAEIQAFFSEECVKMEQEEGRKVVVNLHGYHIPHLTLAFDGRLKEDGSPKIPRLATRVLSQFSSVFFLEEEERHFSIAAISSKGGQYIATVFTTIFYRCLACPDVHVEEGRTFNWPLYNLGSSICPPCELKKRKMFQIEVQQTELRQKFSEELRQRGISPETPVAFVALSKEEKKS